MSVDRLDVLNLQYRDVLGNWEAAKFQVLGETQNKDMDRPDLILLQLTPYTSENVIRNYDPSQRIYQVSVLENGILFPGQPNPFQILSVEKYHKRDPFQPVTRTTVPKVGDYLKFHYLYVTAFTRIILFNPSTNIYTVESIETDPEKFDISFMIKPDGSIKVVDIAYPNSGGITSVEYLPA